MASKAVVIATGLRADGRREVLGVDVGDSENETFWREFLTGLVDRGAWPASGSRSPTHPPALDAVARRRVAAARVSFCAGNRNFELATSSQAKREGLCGPALDFLDALLDEVDQIPGGPAESDVRALAQRYESAGLKPGTPRHAAECWSSCQG